MSQDIKAILKGTGIALEKQALDTFGAAIDNTTAGTLGKIFNVTNSNSNQDATTAIGDPNVWSTTHYASALVKHDQVSFNPKLKFLFKVSFEFDPAMIDAARRMGHDLTKIQQDFNFLIRHIDRPKFDFEYEEVNMYNFRTPILKNIRQREVGFTVYDDIGNAALSFVNVYRKLLQPIARAVQDPSMFHEDHALAFDKTFTGLDTSMRGVLPSDRRNILRKMTIHQIFVERGSTTENPASWVKVIDFVFINPRFTNIDIDDLDHENGGNFNIVTFTANFDTMFMSEPFNHTENKVGAGFPGGDIPANDKSGAQSAMGGTSNPFMDIIVNQGSRAINQSVSNLINDKIKNVPGANLLIGRLPQVSGLIQEAGRKTLTNLTNGVVQAFAKPTAQVVQDSNGGSDGTQVSSSTTGDFF